jgi:two-component system response regulator
MKTDLFLSRPAEVLLAEDNDNDVELTRQGFKRTKLILNLHRVKDGEECLEFLRKQGKYADAPTPDLLLLDLNMPKVSGREVLAEMMADEALKSLPVVVLTTSEVGEEILRMYQMRCSSYIVKPIDFDQFLRAVRSIAEYWFTVVVLPKAS